MWRKAQFDPFGPLASGRFHHYGSARHVGTGWLEPNFSAPPAGGQRDFLAGLEQKKVWLWWGLLAFGMLILLTRVLFLQTVDSAELKSIADGNRIRIQEIKANRGVMYDRQGAQLVRNTPSFSLALVPVDLPKDETERSALINQLAPIAQQSPEQIADLIKNQPFYSYRPLIIRENLSQDEALLADIIAHSHAGVEVLTTSNRFYLTATTSPSLSHVLGYLGKLNDADLQVLLDQGYAYDDYIGKDGLELTYQDTLRGRPGRQQVEVDATGNTKDILAQQSPVPGQSLVLTIDLELQRQAEAALSRTLQQLGKKRGAVIVLDPNSGEVLALVNQPAFDNNLFSHGISQENFSALINDPDKPLFTRAVSGEYPSGSTFKLIMAAAALQEGVIDRTTGVNSVGGIRVNRWFFPDWKAGGHGWTTVTKALAESVNTFFYTIGGGYNGIDGLGVERISQYARAFGLSKTLGIDLPNEADGFIPTQEWKEQTKNEAWYIGDTYNLSIGQGDLLVTPLQVASWTAVFANGGTLYRPHLVKEFVDEHYKTIRTVTPEILNQNFIDADNIAIVNQGLRQTVLSGSARQLGNLSIEVAAKTGTAQWSSKNPNHAWITAFAPYKNPQIVVTVLIEEGGEGSTAAQPVAYQIIDWWAHNR